MSVNGYLFSAYVIIWTVLFVYLCYLAKKQKEIGREVKRLSDLVDKG